MMRSGRVAKLVSFLATSLFVLAAIISHFNSDASSRRKLYDKLYLFDIKNIDDFRQQQSMDDGNTMVPSAGPSSAYSKMDTAVPSEFPSNSPSSQPSSSPSSNPTVMPSASPTMTPSVNPTDVPSSLPTSLPSSRPSAAPTMKPSASPSSNPTASPSSSPSSTPSQSPTVWFDQTVFYAVADVPYNLRQKQKLPGLIHQIPADADFVVHLGDIKSSGTPCNNATFQEAAGFMAASAVPTFFVVGDNEWNDCDDPDAALALWRSMFVRFDRQYWDHDLQVTTMPGRPESFSFMNRGTLFIGLNLVGSPVIDWTEWNDRTTTQWEWTRSLIEGQGGDEPIGAIVIFFHANLDGKHRRFVDPLISYVQNDLQNSIPIMLIGGDNHAWLYEPNYKDQPSILRVRKTGGTTEPPLRIVVTSSAASEFEKDYGTTGKALTATAFHLTRFPPSDFLALNRAEDTDGIASEDLDDDYV